MRKLELIKAHRMEQENEYLKAYKRMFPQARLNIYQMDLISNLDDPKAWQRTLEFWCGNDYRPQSVFKMLDYYRQVKEGTVQTFESKEKAKSQVGKYVETPYVPDPPCKYCGAEFCLKEHREEIFKEVA